MEECIGSIPEGNLKRYGKNILVKAVNKTQAILLSSFKGQSSSVIDPINLLTLLEGLYTAKTYMNLMRMTFLDVVQKMYWP